MMLKLSESQSQSLTNKTTTMDNNTSGGGGKGASTAINSSNTSSSGNNSGIGANNSSSTGANVTAKSNEPGSQITYQSAELLPKLKPVLPVVTQCTYTPCYCEENVWKLCDSVRKEFPSEIDYCHVAFISNQKRMVPMWRQKAGKNEEKLALWDYHVIFLYNPDDRCVVYDMDSDLPFPTHFHRYVSETFRTENILQPEYHRCFRILPASKFLSLFSSDRRHMKRSDGSWIKPPPNYLPISSNGGSNLEQFLDVTTPNNEYGELFTLMELVRRFYKPRQLS